MFGGSCELSSDLTLFDFVIFIGLGFSGYLVSLGPASSSSMTAPSGRTSSLALEVEDSWSNSGEDNETFPHILDGGENSPSSWSTPEGGELMDSITADGLANIPSFGDPEKDKHMNKMHDAANAESMGNTNDVPFTLDGGENAVPSGGMNLCF